MIHCGGIDGIDNLYLSAANHDCSQFVSEVSARVMPETIEICCWNSPIFLVPPLIRVLFYRGIRLMMHVSCTHDSAENFRACMCTHQPLKESPCVFCSWPSAVDRSMQPNAVTRISRTNAISITVTDVRVILSSIPLACKASLVSVVDGIS